jgi:hypothetical protein
VLSHGLQSYVLAWQSQDENWQDFPPQRAFDAQQLAPDELS